LSPFDNQIHVKSLGMTLLATTTARLIIALTRRWRRRDIYGLAHRAIREFSRLPAAGMAFFIGDKPSLIPVNCRPPQFCGVRIGWLPMSRTSRATAWSDKTR